MASLGHVVVGMAAARVYQGRSFALRSWLPAALLWSLLSLAPDADVIGFSFGVEYEDEWGHRGATHSLAFSLAAGAAAGLVGHLLGLPGVRTAVGASLVLASHALLDTLTDGGLGCALLWPFDLTRHFAPWTPIPVAPIGFDFFSPYGLMVALVELGLFAPLLWFAVSPALAGPPRAWRTPVIAIWLASVWLIGSADPLRERLVGLVLREDTEFANGFSDSALRGVRPGHPASQVREQLGAPLHEVHFYWPVRQGCFSVVVQQDSVASAQDRDGCRKLGIDRGTPRSDIDRVMGVPEESCWHYSRGPRGAYYRARVVCYANSSVIRVLRRWHKQ